MKIGLPLSILLLFIFSCKKQSINRDDIRFIKSKAMDSAGNSIYFSFEYNSSGSVTKIFTSRNNDPGGLIADIHYSGNDIIIKPVRIMNAAVETDSEIRYTTDIFGKPVSRIEYNYQEFKEPINVPQKDYKTDTAIYEYDGSGLLTRVTGHYRDSTWFNPGTVQTFNMNGTYVRNYTNSSGNVDQISCLANEKSRVIHGSQVFHSERSIEESYRFEYTQSYINKTDFAHAVLLREFSVLFEKTYPLSEIYNDVPNRIIMSKTTRDENGDILITDGSDTQITISYNSNGFISTMRSYPGLEARKEILYNK